MAEGRSPHAHVHTHPTPHTPLRNEGEVPHSPHTHLRNEGELPHTQTKETRVNFLPPPTTHKPKKLGLMSKKSMITEVS